MLEAGWVVRVGRADPIHHYSSPARDIVRMDLYGRRNAVLCAWYNEPLPDALLGIAGDNFDGIASGIRVGRPLNALRGLAYGYRDCWRERGGRRPVGRGVSRAFRSLRKHGPLPLAEIEPVHHPMKPALLTPGRCLALVLALVPLLVAGGTAAGATAARPASTIDDPYQASQQTLVEFGKRSHWLQPWRGYLETVPAQRVTRGLGIVFNPPAGKADKVATQAAAAGLRYTSSGSAGAGSAHSDSPRLEGMSTIRRLLLALKKHGLRPLILLNGNDGCPGPAAEAEDPPDRRRRPCRRPADRGRPGLCGRDRPRPHRPRRAGREGGRLPVHRRLRDEGDPVEAAGPEPVDGLAPGEHAALRALHAAG